MLILVAMVVVVLLGNGVSGKIYNITEGWTARRNDTSFQMVPGSAINGSYNLVSAPLLDANHTVEYVESDNQLFSLAFYNLNGSGYYLSVMIGVRNSSAPLPVWTANRVTPLSETAVFKKMNGQLILQDSNSTAVVWPEGISKLEMKDTGNLVLYRDSLVIWQSFDHPTNVLLPNQTLVTGQRLTSNANSSTMAEGIYTASIAATGVILFVNASSFQQPYFLWSLTGNNLQAAETVCPDYVTYLRYTASGGVDMSFMKNVTSTTLKPCGTELNVGLASDIVPRYLQLMDNGQLESYKLEKGSWITDFRLTDFLQSQCKSPLACGSYGICAGGGTCNCFFDGEASNKTFPSSTCRKPSWSITNCSSRYVTDFVSMPGVSYFASQYINPDRVSSSVQDCLEACKNNCSCSAVFYDRPSRNCFFAGDIVGSLSNLSQTYDAYLKYQDYSKLVELKAPRPDSRFKKVIVITCSIAAFVVIAGSVLLLWMLRRRQDAEIASLLIALQGPPQKFTYKRLVSATKNFTKELGSGGFGSVYEAVFSNGKRLAVKKLHSSNPWQKQFITEMATMGTVSHVNIVKLCGFCAEPSHQLLVYEFMSNGSLDKWIFRAQERSRTPLDWDVRYSIALGTARGLAYLHEESREPIIHLDIKPENILLDDKFVAKVGDFGMAKLLMNRDTTQVVTGVRGTPGYLAPEWLLHSVATKKCDIYSYGMVLLELIGGRKNLDATSVESSTSWYFPAWAVDQVREGCILDIVDPSIREQADVEQATRLVQVALWCIQDNPGNRPTMDVVVQMLEGQHEVNQPPLSFHFTVQASGMISIKTTQDKIAVAYSAE